jgi:hypothetical protein
MNLNEILAQQQAALNQAMAPFNQVIQNAQHVAAEMMAFELVLFIGSFWVIYMFYARLKGIEDEFRRFRIAYEFGQDRESRARSALPAVPTFSKTIIPPDTKYMPQR